MSRNVSASGTETTDPALLEVRDLEVNYGKVRALNGISLSMEAGDVISIIGPNGAGKTTFADSLSGFHEYSGSITFRGEEIRDNSPREVVEMGLIHTTETRDLFGYMTVEQNLRLGAYRHQERITEQMEGVYDLFPRLAERTNQNAHSMSGGEQQMLAIGRALMADPDLLVLDEPTLGLAPVILEDISDAIDEIQDRGVSVLLCEQNVSFAMNHADHISLLENGEIVREGKPESLADDDYVRDVYLGE